MPGGRRGLVAPQNTFLENIIRRSSSQPDSSFLLANAQIVDYPIVYCNETFCKMSGYNRAEVMQKSCRCTWMYGELTEKEAVERVDRALDHHLTDQFEILLYKKNRTPLWLLVHVAPIRNERELVVLFLLTFRDITALKQPIDADDPKGGLSKFAKLARSVTRSRSVLVSALPALKEPARQSHLAHVSTNAPHVNTHLLYARARARAPLARRARDPLLRDPYVLKVEIGWAYDKREEGEMDETRLEVVLADHFGVADHLAAGPHEGRVEVEHDVDKEDDVDDRVDDEQRHVLARLVLEGHVVRHHDGRVEGQAQDDPVPDGFESAVVHTPAMHPPSPVQAHEASHSPRPRSCRSVNCEHIAPIGSVDHLFSTSAALLYATIFGHVTTIIQQMTSATAKYHDMLNNVREFMKLHEVPKALSERVMDYVVSTWAMTKGLDTDKVLNYCPKDMKADICVHLNRKVFNEHPAFRLASDGCLRALAMHFHMSHSAPGDLLYHTGESIDSLCFIVTGSLEVIQDDEVVAILGKGDVFGDSFWKDSAVGQSAANVRALTYCDLHTIKRDRLLEVLDFYQAFANSFARNLTLTYNLRHRLIFRKVADVRRERELMERRKREPQLEQAQDHLVRKIFSRFRRERSVAAAPAPAPARAAPLAPAAGSSDAERGAGAAAAGEGAAGVAGAPGAAGAETASAGVPRGAAARGKWGRLLAGGSLDAGEAPRAAFSRSLSARDRSAPLDAAASAASAATPTTAVSTLAPTLTLKAAFTRNRASSVLGAATRREAIDEETLASEGATVTTTAAVTAAVAAPVPAGAAPPAPAPAVAASPAPSAPAASPHDAALAELRRDVRNEVQRLQHKLARVEELLTLLATRLGADPNNDSSLDASAERTERTERTDRPDRADRPDRPDRTDRPDRADRPDRERDRSERSDRTDRIDSAGARKRRSKCKTSSPIPVNLFPKVGDNDTLWALKEVQID
ncbi:potassium voltage-gated channel protein eag-like [Zerene cesonia]|uniref:potassium voltage-gated channel protein eag-like n=1 Tax=Zerene cesonia TaxID=33412 RepID=UPI0018E4E13A|nr:potassium voltage-gated channel protein eag-like [Zerene cesonia]